MDAPQLVVRVAATIKDLQANLAEGVNQIETTKAALQRMALSYDGSKIIAQAGATVKAIQDIGGVSKLTTDEQARALPVLDQAIAKYAALGKDAPKGMVDLANSLHQVGASGEEAKSWVEQLGQSFVAHVAEGMLLRDVIRELITLGREAFENAVRYDDLSRATGLSIDQIQRFGYVGKEFGVDVDTMARGVEQLSAKLANGDRNATLAVSMLGLSVKDLLAEGPAAAFLDVADATGHVSDPMLKAGLAAEVFGGKLGKILLPALGELKTRIDAVPKGAILSDANVVNAHELDVSWTHLKDTWGNVFVDLIVRTAEAFGGQAVKMRDVASAAKDLQALGLKPAASHGGVESPVSSHASDEAISKAQAIESALKKLRSDALEPLTAAQRANIDELHKWGASATEIARLITNNNVTAVERYMNAEKDLAKQLAETDAILMTSFEKRTAGLKAVTEANLRAYDFGGQIASLRQLIASEEALARSVYAQLTSEKDRAKVIEELGLRRIEISNQIAALELKHAGVVNAQVIAELEARAALEHAQGRTIDGYVGEMSAYDKMNIALEALHRKKQEGISQYNQEQLIVKQYTDQMYAAALADDALTAATNRHTEAEHARASAIEAAAEAAYKARQDLANYAAAAVPTSDSLTRAGIIASTQSVSGFMQSVSMRAEGGPVSAGSSYVVGERGPEMFVPGSSGTIVPHGAGGVTILPGAIVFNNAILNDPAGKRAVLAIMNEAMGGRLTGTGMRMPTGT